MFGDGAVEHVRELADGQIVWHEVRLIDAVNVLVKHGSPQFRETDDLYEQLADIVGNERQQVHWRFLNRILDSHRMVRRTITATNAFAAFSCASAPWAEDMRGCGLLPTGRWKGFPWEVKPFASSLILSVFVV
jgi:hypothetical protein